MSNKSLELDRIKHLFDQLDSHRGGHTEAETKAVVMRELDQMLTKHVRANHLLEIN